MTVAAPATDIGIVLYPGAQLAAVHGLTDLFAIANTQAGEGRGAEGPPLRVSHWSPAAGEMVCVFPAAAGCPAQPRILILPPTLVDLPDLRTCATIEQWLLTHHARGVRIATICSGIFLVAATGLLDGRVVSTHRTCAQSLMESFPRIVVDSEQRMIEHADILTAGGFMAWVDLGLLLVERLLGEAVGRKTERFVLSHSPVASSPPRPEVVGSQSHDDLAVRRAQQLVHLRDGQGVSLAEMAAAARLERRTFLRRFVTATGRTPIDYCREVRMARARELLAAGNLPIKSIAESLGYGDVSAFARAFRRANGRPPGEYRRQFQSGAVAGQADGPAVRIEAGGQ